MDAILVSGNRSDYKLDKVSSVEKWRSLWMLCTCRLNVFWENIWCKMENNVEKYDVLVCWLYVALDGCVLSMLWCVCGVNIT